MNLASRKVRALGLCSGGLDSILSALVLRRQGIEVEWISFETPFFSSKKAQRAAKNLDIPLVAKDITQIYLEILKNPPSGYGKYMNPCMDCHALMFRQAGEIMKKKGFDFLFSGEVLGQRPFSQNKQSLRYVEKQSGYDGYILRPLSAKSLPETIIEKRGLVKRDMLLDISGRSRKPQIKLAEKFGITEYPSPAGGCLLTDKSFSARLKDLFDNQEAHTEADLHLLKYGRHLRLNPVTKIIVGRTHADNEQIKKFYNPASDTIFLMGNYPGPVVLMPGGGSRDIKILAASICAGYSKAPNNAPVEVKAVSPQGSESIEVIGIPPQSIKHFLI